MKYIKKALALLMCLFMLPIAAQASQQLPVQPLAVGHGHHIVRRAVDKLKKAHKFTQQELGWISRMEKYLLEESVLNVGVFDEDSRFKSKGGFAKINKAFANKLESIVLELNEYLYDDGGRTA